MTKPVKVTINSTKDEVPTPAKAKEAWTVTDALGRVIEVKKPNVLNRLRLIAALGPELSKNEQYSSMCAVLLFLKSIDGDLVEPPKNQIQIEALMQRLDDAGLEAIQVGVKEFIFTENEDQDLSDRDEQVKN